MVQIPQLDSANDRYRLTSEPVEVATVGECVFDLGALLALAAVLIAFSCLIAQQLVADASAALGGGGALTVLAGLVMLNVTLALSGASFLALIACGIAAWRLKRALANRR